MKGYINRLKAFIFGKIYKAVRFIVLRGLGVVGLEKRNGIEWGITAGDWILGKLYRSPLGGPLFRFEITQPKTLLYDLEFESPLTIAAFKNDPNMLNMWLSLGAGGVTLKTILADPQPGNPKPRIQQVDIDDQPHLINALGLPGPGLNHLITQLPHQPFWTHRRPVGISIGGHSATEYIQNGKAVTSFVSERLANTPIYIEINISCPNTPKGQQLTQDPTLFEQVLSELRSNSELVIVTKLSPDQPNDDLLIYTEIIKRFEKTAVNVGNTQFRSTDQVGLSKSAISVGGGGLSGPSLFPRTLEMIRLLSPLNVPIIATGGISNASNANAALEAGATLLGIATTAVFNPYSIVEINQGIRSSLIGRPEHS